MDPRSGTPSRNLIVEDIVARTGIDEAMIDRLVRTFYARARLDPLIGPVFESRVQDWESHFGRMCAFWSSVALMSGRYHGQPMAAHLPLPVDTPHFTAGLRSLPRPPAMSVRRRPPTTSSSGRTGSPTASSWASRATKARSGETRAATTTWTGAKGEH